MKFVIALVCLAAVVYGAPTDSPQDPFIQLIKEIELSDFFPKFDRNKQILAFELLSAAETNNLIMIFEKIGYITLLEFIDALPEEFQHRFVSYSVGALNNEYPLLFSSLPPIQTK